MTPTLAHLLKPLGPYLADPRCEEICVNEPGRAWVWSGGGFTPHAVELDADEIIDIGIVAGAARRQDIHPKRPLLATDLQGQGRLQVVLPPCVEQGKPSLTIRRGNAFSPTVASLSEAGLFTGTLARRPGLTGADHELLDLYRAQRWEEFCVGAVRAKKTVVICGETGSGKTTFAKALIGAIPLAERLISVEDTPEWTDLPHQNRVALYYDKDGGPDTVRPGQLVEAALRMRIGRLLVQELRDGPAAYAFLRALASGHPGGITTVHAGDCLKAFDAVRLMLKETQAGASQSNTDLMAMLRERIDIVVHCHRPDDVFGISEVWFAANEIQDAAEVSDAIIH